MRRTLAQRLKRDAALKPAGRHRHPLPQGSEPICEGRGGGCAAAGREQQQLAFRTLQLVSKGGGRLQESGGFRGVPSCQGHCEPRLAQLADGCAEVGCLAGVAGSAADKVGGKAGDTRGQ